MLASGEPRVCTGLQETNLADQLDNWGQALPGKAHVLLTTVVDTVRRRG